MRFNTHIAGFMGLVTLGFGLPSGGFAQTPLSAIEWLNYPLGVPIITALPPNTAIPSDPTNPTGDEPPVALTVLIPDISVTPLGQAEIGAVGLLPASVTGLPRNLWETSTSSRLGALVRSQNVDDFPAMQTLLYTLLLAEAAPPKDAGQKAEFLLARIDKLIALGAVEPAEAMLDRAGTTTGSTTPDLFRRWFDLTLLNGSEDQACAALMTHPQISPGYSEQVFCTARSGDWLTASLTLDTARALGFMDPFNAEILARFLDPELYEGAPNLSAPPKMTPLIFRLFEAIGTPLPTGSLPRAYAMADLRNTSGWKAELEAAERLARTSALSENRLLGIYTARKPAASGGIWDRVYALQHFDIAIETKDASLIGQALPKVWAAMQTAHLEVPFARLYGGELLDHALPSPLRPLAFRIALLAPTYEDAAQKYAAKSKSDRFLAGIATGTPDLSDAPHPIGRAIAAGFATTALPDRFATSMENGELGLVILQSMRMFTRSSGGNLQGITDSIATFRALGLEDVARRAALQLMLLKRGV
ncbi:MAG: hypothetical protein Q9M48_08720 [Rhodobacterales bacterium]|nr:hypothetical protein [Rhodobacterales bacterium]